MNDPINPSSSGVLFVSNWSVNHRDRLCPADHMDHPAIINRKARSLILDYALGAAIVALLPIPNINTLKIVILAVLNLSLIASISRLWQFQRGSDWLAKLGILFGVVGSIFVSLIVWLLMLIISILINQPKLMILVPGAIAFSYFWSAGQTVQHFYLSKAPKMRDPDLLPRETAHEP